MNSKKVWTWVLIILIVVIVGVLVWKYAGTTSTNVPTSEEGATGGTGAGGGQGAQTSEQSSGDASKVSDEAYIEIMAQATYYSQKDPTKWPDKAKELFSKYNVTDEDITAYGSQLQSDPVRMQEFSQKYAERVQELLKQ